MSSKSVFNLNENVVGALSYAGVFVTGILFLVLEKDNKFVRFHALQSTIFFGALCALSWVVCIIPFFGGILSGLIQLLSLVAYLYLIFTAYKGQTFRIPFLGDIVWEQTNK